MWTRWMSAAATNAESSAIASTQLRPYAHQTTAVYGAVASVYRPARAWCSRSSTTCRSCLAYASGSAEITNVSWETACLPSVRRSTLSSRSSARKTMFAAFPSCPDLHPGDLPARQRDRPQAPTTVRLQSP